MPRTRRQHRRTRRTGPSRQRLPRTHLEPGGRLTTVPAPFGHILTTAARGASIVLRDVAIVRIGENAVLRARPGVIARISRPGQNSAAAREVEVSRWLAEQGIPVVRPLAVDQHAVLEGRAVTWWEELPNTVPTRSPT
ncbi:phosphotransferase [Nocardiopsis endophytica]|uniref:phosphotransferase n=1 Tax=Nocardiopsis endophytica TaxID=3018445 RepID=UPI0038CDBE01